MRKSGRPCYSNRKIWTIERRSYNNISLASTYGEKQRHCIVICIRFFCSPKIRTTMSHSFSLQFLRLEDVVRRHKILKLETIDFEDLQWTPPSSPQYEEGVTLQLPSLNRAEEISSISLECPPIETPPLHNVCWSVTNFLQDIWTHRLLRLVL